MKINCMRWGTPPIPPWLAAIGTAALLFALWYASWAVAAGFTP